MVYNVKLKYQMMVTLVGSLLVFRFDYSKIFKRMGGGKDSCGSSSGSGSNFCVVLYVL